MKLIKHHPNVHAIKWKSSSVNEVVKLGAFSDVHFDSQYCHRKLFKKHLEYVDYAFIFGDLFDVMGCWRDPRSKPENIRPEYIRKDKGYLDTVIEDAYEFLKPYASKLLILGRGNHETEIQRRHDTYILDRLAFMLRQSGSQVETGGYSGFVRVQCQYSKAYSSELWYYHHGAGGNAARSKDMLRSQIDSFAVPDADIIFSGHTHNKVYDPSNVSMYLDPVNHKIKFRAKKWIKTGSYKRNDDNPGYAGWTVQKDFKPTHMGGWCIDYNYNRTESKLNKRIYELD